LDSTDLKQLQGILSEPKIPQKSLENDSVMKGEVKQSLTHLKKAVSLDHSVKDWARRDTDLKNLHGRPEFEEIMGRGIKTLPDHPR